MTTGTRNGSRIIKLTESFMTDRKASLLINRHESSIKPTMTGIPQGSPVTPILFAIYISGIFEEIAEEVLRATGLSFVDDISWIATGKDVMEVTKLLEAYSKAAKTWAARNAV
jgi:retron-type reverse transcriptase